jgi:hypothetical protein
MAEPSHKAQPVGADEPAKAVNEPIGVPEVVGTELLESTHTVPLGTLVGAVDW